MRVNWCVCLCYRREKISIDMSMKKTSIIATNLWRQKRSKSLHEMPPGLQLTHVVEKLQRFAPEKYAEPWDNVGLLIEPSGLK